MTLQSPGYSDKHAAATRGTPREERHEDHLEGFGSGFGLGRTDRAVCAQIADRIVAIVNEDVITLSELNAAFEPYAARINATYRGGDKDKVMAEGRTAILNRMIDNKLIEQQSKQSGLTVKDDEAMNVIRGCWPRKKWSWTSLSRSSNGTVPVWMPTGRRSRTSSCASASSAVKSSRRSWSSTRRWAPTTRSTRTSMRARRPSGYG